MKALILAAGYATRLYPLTKNKAKALLPVKDKPIIDYIVDQMLTLPDVDEIVVVSNHKFYEQFADWAENRHFDSSHVQITVLDDGSTCEEDRLGAIGDIQFAIEKLKIADDLLVEIGRASC